MGKTDFTESNKMFKTKLCNVDLGYYYYTLISDKLPIKDYNEYDFEKLDYKNL